MLQSIIRMVRLRTVAAVQICSFHLCESLNSSAAVPEDLALPGSAHCSTDLTQLAARRYCVHPRALLIKLDQSVCLAVPAYACMCVGMVNQSFAHLYTVCFQSSLLSNFEGARTWESNVKALESVTILDGRLLCSRGAKLGEHLRIRAEQHRACLRRASLPLSLYEDHVTGPHAQETMHS